MRKYILYSIERRILEEVSLTEVVQRERAFIGSPRFKTLRPESHGGGHDVVIVVVFF